MLRAIYVVLLRLHPCHFRQQFADEMLWIFDQTSSSRAALLGDAVRSLGTQWMFRSDDRPALVAGPSSDRVPVFYLSGSEIPPPAALFNGLLGSVGVFALACFALQHSGGHARVFTYYGNDFHAGPPVYGEPSGPPPSGPPTPSQRSSGRPPDTTRDTTADATAPKPASATEGPVSGPSSGSTSGPSALVLAEQRAAVLYFKSVPILAALDTDHDGELSAEEIAESPAILLALDRNHDGKLDAKECGYRPPLMSFDKNGDGKLQRNELPRYLQDSFDRFDANHDGVLSDGEIRNLVDWLDSGGAPTDPVMRRARLDFMRLERVLAVLDANHDSVISLSEMANAPAALKTLDLNHDGRLTMDEVARDPVANEVAAIFRLDTDFDARISADERSNPFGQHVRMLLDAADRNGNQDGYVTWEELAAEIQRRADLNHDGKVTWEELMQARSSGALNGPPAGNKPRRPESNHR